MEWQTIAIAALGLLQPICFGLAAWALNTVVAQGKEIAALNAKNESLEAQVIANRDDAREDTKQVFAKLDAIGRRLDEVLLHRRASDNGTHGG